MSHRVAFIMALGALAGWLASVPVFAVDGFVITVHYELPAGKGLHGQAQVPNFVSEKPPEIAPSSLWFNNREEGRRLAQRSYSAPALELPSHHHCVPPRKS